MTITIIGQLVPVDGGYQSYDRAGDPHPGCCTPLDFCVDQRRDLQLHVDHDEGWPIGIVEHLERSRALGLMLVARCRDSAADLLDDGEWFLSPRYRAIRTSAVTETYAHLIEASICQRPAGVGLAPVRWTRHDLGDGGGGAPTGLPLRWHDVWRRATATLATPIYRRSATLEVIDVDTLERIADATIAACADAHVRSTDDSGRIFRHSYGGSSLAFT